MILLALTCAFGMVACNGGGTPPDNDTLDVSAFTTAIAATNPATVEIDTKLETEIGDLVGEFVFTYASDGSATIEYSYEKFNELGAGVTEAKSVVEGEVALNADGSYSGSGLSGNATAVGAFTLTLDVAKLKDAEINGNVLTATVEAANNKAVLGVETGYDVEMILTKSASGIVSLVLTYTTTSGPATITCSYN